MPSNPLRPNADDRQQLSVDNECASEDIGIRGEARHPVVVTEHGEGVPARNPVILGRERASERSADAEHVEVVAGNQLPCDAFGLALEADAERHAKAAQHAAEHVIVIANVTVGRVRQSVAAHRHAVTRAIPSDAHELVWAADRQRSQKHLIEE